MDRAIFGIFLGQYLNYRKYFANVMIKRINDMKKIFNEL